MDLRALLKRLEWSASIACGVDCGCGDRICPTCGNGEGGPHAADCELAAALASLDGAHVQVTRATGHYRSVDYEEAFVVADKPPDGMKGCVLTLCAFMPDACLNKPAGDDGPHGEFDVTVVFRPTE